MMILPKSLSNKEDVKVEAGFRMEFGEVLFEMETLKEVQFYPLVAGILGVNELQ